VAGLHRLVASAQISTQSGALLVVVAVLIATIPAPAQSSGAWAHTGTLNFPRIHTATLLTSGNVLAYGNKFSCYAAQTYSPSTNTWARTIGQCGNDTSYGPLVLLRSGKVLLAGDEITYSGHTSPTARCALYDPSTNTWTSTGSLFRATSRAATLLPNGKVLSVGSGDAELYTP